MTQNLKLAKTFLKAIKEIDTVCFTQHEGKKDVDNARSLLCEAIEKLGYQFNTNYRLYEISKVEAFLES